ncbi:hypothetical protein [Sphingomonas paucimobilis]|uniref:hypothetical protein n=1 Tax=Sphingomonas paucimobilis TaxID=13689 RepID=UPI00064C35F3|nr:hypothetical protein [Sphingomonas paucimobilis]
MSAPIVDPDLVRALDELRPVASNLRMLEEQMLVVSVRQNYKQFGYVSSRRDDAADAIAGRAKSLCMKPGSLRLAVELASDFHKRHGRRISLDQLRRQVATATLALKSASLQAQADKAAQDWRSERAGLALDAADGLANYLENSRKDAAHG